MADILTFDYTLEYFKKCILKEDAFSLEPLITGVDFEYTDPKITFPILTI